MDWLSRGYFSYLCQVLDGILKLRHHLPHSARFYYSYTPPKGHCPLKLTSSTFLSKL